jgi:hypothetical protein
MWEAEKAGTTWLAGKGPKNPDFGIPDGFLVRKLRKN